MDARKFNKKKNPRRETVELYLSVEEKNLLIDLAEKEHLPISTFIRWRLFKDS